MSIIVTPREGLGVAKVLARRDTMVTLRQHFEVHFGLTLPNALRRVSVHDVAAVGVGPGAWLVVQEGGGNDWPRHLKSLLANSACISDQSDAYVVLRLTGSDLRETLARLVPIDLHSRVFAPGHVAETVASHLGVIVWRLEDDAKRPVFELAVSRSFSASLYHALAAIVPNSESVRRLVAAHTINSVNSLTAS